MRRILFVSGPSGRINFVSCSALCNPFIRTFVGREPADFTHYHDIIDDGDTANQVFQDFVKHRLAIAKTPFMRLFWGTRSGKAYSVRYMQLQAILNATERATYGPVALPDPYCDGTLIVTDRPFPNEEPPHVINFK